MQAGELQWLASRCRPEILYAVNMISQAISKNPKEAVYRGGHLLRYLKRFPEAAIFYSNEPTCDFGGPGDVHRSGDRRLL